MRAMTAFLLCVTLFMVSCGPEKPKSSNSETRPPGEAPVSMAAAPGMPTTRGIEASSIIGYDGVGMRRSVDNAVKQSDAENAETKKALDEVSKQ